MIARAFIPGLAVLVFATGFGFAAQQQVTIAAEPTELARNRLLTLYGAIPAPREKEIVVIQARDCGQSTFRDVARVPTVVGGRYSWDYFYPGITATIRAVWQGKQSTPVRVRDRAFVELRAWGDGTYVVDVRAKTPFVGRRALLQRLTQSGWKTIRSVRLTESGAPPGSTYVYSSGRADLDVPKRTLVRALFPRQQAKPCYLAGYSNMLRS